MRQGRRWGGLDSKKGEYVALGLIVLLGAILRFYQLESIPVGLSGDEGADGLGAKRILSGEELPIFITEDFGEEPMHTYMVAGSFALWGVSLWAIRFVSASVGLVTIPLVFWLAKEILPTERRSACLVPILSAFFLSTSYWHIIYSRAGLEVVTLPLFSSAVILLLWRGIRTERKWALVAAGLILGASLYSYRGARFLPILLTIFFGGWLALSRDFRRTHFVNLVLVALVATLVCLPLGIYAVAHPDIFFAREMHVSIFNPDWGRGSPLEAFGYAVVKTMGMFNFQGDPQFDRNPGQRAVLDPVSSLCFVIGLAVVLWRWKRPTDMFIVFWFVIMALPGAFTAEALPHFHRGIGALPPLVLMCATGASFVKDWLTARVTWRGGRWVSWAALALILVSTAVLSARDYFVPWQPLLDEGEITGRSYMEAAGVMNTTRLPGGVWILPASPLRPVNLPYYEVSFLYDGPEPEHTLNVDESTAAEELSRLCEGHRRAAVINWKEYVLEEAYLSLNSDPKGLVDYLLRKYGRHTGTVEHQSFDLVTYELPAAPDFSLAQTPEQMGVDFGGELRLEMAALGGSSLASTSTPEEVERQVLPSGKEGWVTLQWTALRDLDRNYKVAVYLLDGKGRAAGQVDKLLLSNHLQPTSGWEAGQLEMDYYTLPCAPATAPGHYAVEVVVYDAETTERLLAFDAQTGVATTSLTVGELQVVQPSSPPEVEPIQQLAPTDRHIAPGVQLLGYDMPSGIASPGEIIRVAVYWSATEDVIHDYLISVQLRDGKDRVWLDQTDRPVDGTYPTTEWDEGEVLRDWHDVRLPADAPEGRHEVLLYVVEGGETVGQVSLGSFEIHGRPRRFEIADIQHPMQARVGEGVLFLGYDLGDAQVHPGESVQITLYWQALEEMEVSYTVFTHLLDETERMWGQLDSIPQGGQAPTTSWVEGEVVADPYEIALDQTATPGWHTVEIGMYDSNTGHRLPVFADGTRLEADRLLIGNVEIVE